MEVLPPFALLRARSVEEALKWRLERPNSRLLGGGTDLIVNLRRGIGDAPEALIDITGIDEMNVIAGGGETLRIGAAVKLAVLASHPLVLEHYPGVAEAAASVAGASQRNMATVGGNLCLDTRCIFYNQSEWWRVSNGYCLKYGGSKCHVAPKSSVCYATFSGDLAPALLVLDGEVEIAGRDGRRTVPLADLYRRDGRDYLSLAPQEFVCSARVHKAPDLRAAYDKIRVRRALEFPLAGVAVALAREGGKLSALRAAVTGTNPWPVVIEDTASLCGGGVDEALLERFESLLKAQIMAMKTTFTSGHYRRRAATVLARRLVQQLFDG